MSTSGNINIKDTRKGLWECQGNRILVHVNTLRQEDQD